MEIGEDLLKAPISEDQVSELALAREIEKAESHRICGSKAYMMLKSAASPPLAAT
ncbi:Uncharacterised protein [Mycobacteroides abscessus subsp. abscessus]|nr:hypothetical protein B14911_07890 [Bacillus sp. NRRL B-14911]SIE31985.1 Uncharacterised protein [Mycobacteroides abscessus subsp. abscessus]